jgi:hypothetical protein
MCPPIGVHKTKKERKSMSKNMTRKGLALGAGLSLAFTGLVAPAAYAIDPVQLKETVGTGYNVLNTGNFEVTALITNAAISGGSETVKFRIVATAGDLTNAGIDVGDGTAATPDGLLSATSGTGAVNDVLATFTDGVAVVNSGGITAGTAYELMLDPATTADGFSVTVQAWVDFDGDNVIDAGEYASPVRTVNFYAADEVTYTLNLVTPTLGAANINSTVTTSPALNVAASSALSVGYATYVASTGAYTTLAAPTVVDNAGVFSAGVARDATDGDHKQAISGGGLAAGTYVAQAMAAGVEVGSAVFYTVGASKATTISAVSIVKSANTGVTGNDLAIRTNTSATFKVTVTGASSVPVAGETVVFSFTENHADTDAVISVGGHSIKNGDLVKTVTAVTDADGVATATASFSGFSAVNDFMNVTAKVAAVAATSAVAPDFVDTAFGAIYSHNTLGTSAILKVAAGSSYSLTYSVLDNFGALLANSNYRVKLVDGGSVTTTAALGSGIASFNVTDQTTVNEAWVASVEAYSTSTANWGNSLGSVTVTPTVGASNGASAVTVSGTTTGLDLNLNPLIASDTRLGQTAPTLASGTVATLSGTVTDASGAATYSSVTLSAPGVMFVSGAVSSLGSITVQTSAAGGFGGVAVYSNTSGVVTVTATAGAASKTLDLTFDAAVATTGTALTVNVQNAVAGATMTISGTLADKYGNAVTTNASKLKVTYTGPGFVVGALPTATDANGAYEFKVLLGSNDVVTGNVTVSYAGADDAFTTGATSDDLTVTQALAPAVVSDAKVNAGSFKGYVAVYAKGYEGKRLSAKIGNDWVIVDSLASNFERVTDFTGAGVSISVRIYIDRVLVGTFPLVTK